jgi:hypothetical protein
VKEKYTASLVFDWRKELCPEGKGTPGCTSHPSDKDEHSELASPTVARAMTRVRILTVPCILRACARNEYKPYEKRNKYSVEALVKGNC